MYVHQKWLTPNVAVDNELTLRIQAYTMQENPYNVKIMQYYRVLYDAQCYGSTGLSV